MGRVRRPKVESSLPTYIYMDFPVFPVCVPFGEMGNSFPEINSGLEIIGVPWDKIHQCVSSSPVRTVHWIGLI